MSFCCVVFFLGVVGTKSLCESLNVNSSTELSNLSADEGFFDGMNQGLQDNIRDIILGKGGGYCNTKSYIRLHVINQHM